MSQSTIKKIFLHLTNFINLCLVNELQNYKKLKLFLYLIEKNLHAVLGNIYIYIFEKKLIVQAILILNISFPRYFTRIKKKPF